MTRINKIRTKIYYTVLCIIITFFITIILFEIFLQTLPYIYRLMPVNNNVQYIYVLGESTAAGFPYDNKISYSKIIETIIKDNKINDKKIKLINLAQTGCQLYHQYINYVLYRYLHPTHKGMMLLYIGTNNWAKESKYNNFKRKLLLKIEVYKLLDKYIKFLKFDAYEYDGYDFQYEYEKIVLLAKKFAEDVYMSTISGNYEFPPDTNNTPIENEEIDKLYFNKDYNKAKELCIKYLEDKRYEDKSQFWYRLGMILKEENNISEANEVLFKSVMYDVGDSPTVFQNEVIRKIAKKYDIPLFDFFEELCNSGKIIGYDFFIDTIHPTIETNINIAYGFIDLLSAKYKFDYIKKEELDIEELKKILKFNNNSMARVLMNVIIEIKDKNEYAIKFNEKIYLKLKNILEVIEVDDKLLPNRKYINEFLDFERKIVEIKKSDMPKNEDLKKLTEYKRETCNPDYFDTINNE